MTLTFQGITGEKKACSCYHEGWTKPQLRSHTWTWLGLGVSVGNGQAAQHFAQCLSRLKALRFLNLSGNMGLEACSESSISLAVQVCVYLPAFSTCAWGLN